MEDCWIPYQDYKTLEYKNCKLKSEIEFLNQKILFYKFEIDNLQKKGDEVEPEERDALKKKIESLEHPWLIKFSGKTKEAFPHFINESTNQLDIPILTLGKSEFRTLSRILSNVLKAENQLKRAKERRIKERSKKELKDVTNLQPQVDENGNFATGVVNVATSKALTKKKAEELKERIAEDDVIEESEDSDTYMADTERLKGMVGKNENDQKDQSSGSDDTNPEESS